MEDYKQEQHKRTHNLSKKLSPLARTMLMLRITRKLLAMVGLRSSSYVETVDGEVHRGNFSMIVQCLIHWIWGTVEGENWLTLWLGMGCKG